MGDRADREEVSEDRLSWVESKIEKFTNEYPNDEYLSQIGIMAGPHTLWITPILISSDYPIDVLTIHPDWESSSGREDSPSSYEDFKAVVKRARQREAQATEIQRREERVKADLRSLGFSPPGSGQSQFEQDAWSKRIKLYRRDERRKAAELTIFLIQEVLDFQEQPSIEFNYT